jgi:hypothetical protein
MAKRVPKFPPIPAGYLITGLSESVNPIFIIQNYQVRQAQLGGGRGPGSYERTSKLIAPALHTTIHNMQKNGIRVQFKVKPGPRVENRSLKKTRSLAIYLLFIVARG